ncbi:cell envelope integrity protein TolA [bacterium]|nr:cell envelope integrity protein TolA [bacterium]
MTSSRQGTFIFGAQDDAKKTKHFRIVLGISLLSHILIFIIFGTNLFFQNSRRIEFESIPARLVRLGEERDKKLLPRVTKPETAPKTAKKDPVPQKETVKKVEEKKTPENAKPNSLKKPEEKKSEKKAEKAPEQKKQKAQSLDELLAGKTIESIKRDARAEVSNEGAKDGVEDGEVTDPALALKANMYARKVAQLIRGNWNIPSIISPAELKTLKTEIFFRITFDGGIYDIKIGKSSGNKIFDSSVIEAIRKTGKLPLPEDKEFRKLVLKEGFVCPFSAN